jgi:hypothetical protein
MHAFIVCFSCFVLATPVSPLLAPEWGFDSWLGDACDEMYCDVV